MKATRKTGLSENIVQLFPAETEIEEEITRVQQLYAEMEMNSEELINPREILAHIAEDLVKDAIDLKENFPQAAITIKRLISKAGYIRSWIEKA